MERSLLVSELTVTGEQSILVASVHLESLDNTDVRIAQLKEAFYYIGWNKRAVLVGDFNFSDDWKENSAIPHEYKDLWIEIRKNFTPTMMKTPKFSPWRPDHIIAKAVDLKSSKIQLLGDFTVPPYEDEKLNLIEVDGLVRTPSDHLGLICEIHFD